MHWEIHITEFKNIEGEVEPNKNVHSKKKFRLREYNIASSTFESLCKTCFDGAKIFHNGLTKVGISDRIGENRWYMIALTLEKGWA